MTRTMRPKGFCSEMLRSSAGTAHLCYLTDLPHDIHRCRCGEHWRSPRSTGAPIVEMTPPWVLTGDWE
jgi:hypothetical protein